MAVPAAAKAPTIDFGFPKCYCLSFGVDGSTKRVLLIQCLLLCVLVPSKRYKTNICIAGGHPMNTLNDPPPPPLASDVAMSSLQCQLAVENICVATSQLLSLIRTLRLSMLLMDEETIMTEEEYQVYQAQQITLNSIQEANEIEQQWMISRNNTTNPK